MKIIDDHVVFVRKKANRPLSPHNVVTPLFWGDEVDDVESFGGATRITLGPGRVGWVPGRVRTRNEALLRVAFVDVGQGDACLLESPTGRRILVDGGEHQRLARYIATRFGRGSTPTSPVVFDAVVVTHGDADHFSGLAILGDDAAREAQPGKQVHFATERVFHNGLVKRPVKYGSTKRAPAEMFGKTESHRGRLHVVDLADDLRRIDAQHMNRPFRAWVRALEAMHLRHPLVCKRVEAGDDALFSFFDPAVKVEVLGPITTRLASGHRGLAVLRDDRGQPSAAHTINGHSVVLRLTYGNVRFFLAADLNSEAEGTLLRRALRGTRPLTSEVLKVPHHGSGDFAAAFLAAVQPVASIVSAGDEDGMHEYIHPRANLLGALGKSGRTDAPLVFCTDLAAFDRYSGPALPLRRLRDGTHVPVPGGKPFYARERTNHGIVHARTDGNHLLIATKSGRPDRVEAHVFEINSRGRVRSRALRRA